MKDTQEEKTDKILRPDVFGHEMTDQEAADQGDIFADLEATLDQVAEANPRIKHDEPETTKATSDLKALLEVSLAVNSSLVLDDVLQIVMRNAIELMQAERGLIMLLTKDDELQVKTAYNLREEDILDEDFRVSSSITSQVASTGKSVYTSDAMADERYSQQASIVEMHLRSIMCVPIKDKEEIIGVIYVDNSNQTKMFLKSDLYLFELYAQSVANALRNASHYDALLQLKLYNESVIKKSPIGTIVIDDLCHIATISPVALEVLELNCDAIQPIGTDAVATNILDLFPDHEKPRWQNMIETVFATGEDFADDRYFHNTGYVEKVLSIRISPLSVMPGGGRGLIMAIEDITEKVVMEKYVILSEKLAAKGEMAASIAHELNNYLAIASTNAELLGMNVDRRQYDKARFNAKSIVDNIFKIKRFVDSLMDFSKPDPEYISYDIRHLIEDLLFSLRVQPRFKRTHFTIDLGQEIPNLEMDVGQIQQVLMNLLNNAADAIAERAVMEEAEGNKLKREIGITAGYDEDGQQVSVEITDNGIGMSEATLAKVFNMHFTTKKGGHGLGLANCRKIVENHYGELMARSKQGEGTNFKVVLPRYQPKHTESD